MANMVNAPRANFARDLSQLQDELQSMGGMVENSIVRSIDALRSRDLQASEEMVKTNASRY